MTNKYFQDFEPESIYHIFSHANASDLLFREEKNYIFFLKKLQIYLLPVAEIFAYCLIPNHFHLLIKFKSEKEICNNLSNTEIVDFHKVLMQQITNFLNSYTKSFNKVYGRKGALFIDYIRRTKVEDENYLRKVLHYIHNNPVNLGLVSRIEDWRFSSYQTYLNENKPSKISKELILSYFETIDDLKLFHQSKIEEPLFE